MFFVFFWFSAFLVWQVLSLMTSFATLFGSLRQLAVILLQSSSPITSNGPQYECSQTRGVVTFQIWQNLADNWTVIRTRLMIIILFSWNVFKQKLLSGESSVPITVNGLRINCGLYSITATSRGRQPLSSDVINWVLLSLFRSYTNWRLCSQL